MQCESEITGKDEHKRCTNEGLRLAALDFSEEGMPLAPSIEQCYLCADCAARMAQAFGTLVVFMPLEAKPWNTQWPSIIGQVHTP